ncbi:arylsulfatase [Flavihumibacter petaseus]|uniref:Putative arylsulfatase n=1 Tax=Flavihumibacter petaseus NBRC 106054 TaxID=1220578 RepID=A0A0E9N217_9BACT|nr:arylsulfatase [Flavihumibacter petaseus]GAO44062.1 putative arylsulfatase [Flavihumibacter petaseus NBRC 106054]
MRAIPNYAIAFLLPIVLFAACKQPSQQETATTTGADKVAGESDRTILPVKEPARQVFTELDARNAKPPVRFEVKAPKSAPNVLIILVDDMGFGIPSAMGGPVSMPNSERLAKDGLTYTRFHTTALCSPTRIALLTGRNHHSCNMGNITEAATAFPGSTGMRPQDIAPLAEMLRLNGFNTAWFGKSHETPAWEISVSGPYDRWPTRSGFEKFYGFLGAETNQWYPGLFEGETRIETPKDPAYNLMPDLADQAINWIRAQKSLTPDKPFFTYFAPGATHTPHHVPKEWIDKYKGKFDEGWDKLREQTLERQKKLGIVPQNTKLAPKPKDMKDWNQYSASERKALARQMEIYAGFAEYADYHIGRVLDAIDSLGQLDNTLVFYILGDNGGSPEGGVSGGSELAYLNGSPTTFEEYNKDLEKQGGPLTYPHYSAFWAVAADCPFAWTKEIAANFGGTRNGMIVRWPKGIRAKGEKRSQFSHVIDVAPTILEACGLPEPKEVNGITQRPIEGTSILYSFDNAAAPERHMTQYFEITGSRALYHDGWVAAAIHKEPWAHQARSTLQNDQWELYNVNEDFSESTDLSAQNPAKLKELQDLFLKEAEKFHVLPLDDRTLEKLNAAIAGRPDLMGGRTSLTVYNHMPGMMENAFINVKNVSFSVSADIDQSKPSNGVIICQGGRFGGWSLYMKGGKPVFHYNWLGKERYTVVSKEAAPSGKSTIRMEFAYDGGGIGKGGTVTIFINDKQVATGRIDKTQAIIFSGDETADVGNDDATPVTEDYKVLDNAFTGGISKVTVTVKPAEKATAKR